MNHLFRVQSFDELTLIAESYKFEYSINTLLLKYAMLHNGPQWYTMVHDGSTHLTILAYNHHA
jgi:hypothetical protein